jgi:hypothetical protein
VPGQRVIGHLGQLDRAPTGPGLNRADVGHVAGLDDELSADVQLTPQEVDVIEFESEHFPVARPASGAEVDRGLVPVAEPARDGVHLRRGEDQALGVRHRWHTKSSPT